MDQSKDSINLIQTKQKKSQAPLFGQTSYLLQNKKSHFENENVFDNNFNVSKSSKNIQLIEREWLDRFQTEKERNRTKERESKKQITKLNNELK
jgi:hypothetical protein